MIRQKRNVWALSWALAGLVSASSAGAQVRDIWGRRRGPSAQALRDQLGFSNGWKGLADYTPPELVSELNTPYVDVSSFVSGDGLTILFCSDRPSPFGQFNIWQASRSSRSSPFGEPVLLGEGINGPEAEILPTMTADERTMVFVRTVDNSWGMCELFMAERPHPNLPFEDVRPLSELNVPDRADIHPWISPDGLTLYFASDRPGSDGDSADVWYTTRRDRSSTWAAPQRVPGVNTPSEERGLVLRADGLVGYLTRALRIYVVTRSSTSEDFGNPELIVALDERGFAAGPAVTADGMELYFYAEGPGEVDIWRAFWEGSDGQTFIRGDVDGDGQLVVTDPVFLLHYLFIDGREPPCLGAADVDDNGRLHIVDPIYLLNFLFTNGPPPPPPFPSCGVDPTEDDIGCIVFPPCDRPE